MQRDTLNTEQVFYIQKSNVYFYISLKMKAHNVKFSFLSWDIPEYLRYPHSECRPGGGEYVLTFYSRNSCVYKWFSSSIYWSIIFAMNPLGDYGKLNILFSDVLKTKWSLDKKQYTNELVVTIIQPWETVWRLFWCDHFLVCIDSHTSHVLPLAPEIW